MLPHLEPPCGRFDYNQTLYETDLIITCIDFIAKIASDVVNQITQQSIAVGEKIDENRREVESIKELMAGIDENTEEV